MTKPIPKLKGKRLDDFIGLPIERAIKQELKGFKDQYDLDHLEWIRGLVRDGLPELRKRLKETA